MKNKGKSAAEARMAKADTPARYRDFQSLLFRAVVRPLTRDDESDPAWHDGRDANAVLGAFVKGDAFRDPLRRVQTYNRMYWYRLLDSFAEDFPGVRALTGTRFVPLAEAYLQKHPSTSFTLRHLGHAFPDWLRKNTFGLPATKAAACADCAKLEWALCHAFEAGAGEPPDPESFADPAKLRLALQPHLTLLDLAYDAPDFLDRLKPAENGHAEAGNAAAVAGPEAAPGTTVRIRKKRTFAAVFRTPGDDLAIVRLVPVEHTMLADIAAGLTLGRTLDRAAARRDAPSPEAVARLFASWSARGWLAVRERRRRSPDA